MKTRERALMYQWMWWKAIFSLAVIFPIFQSLPSDFALDIAGSSIIAAAHHICAIEYKHGVDIGGKIYCSDDSLKTNQVSCDP
jgi:hypothetical protein